MIITRNKNDLRAAIDAWKNQGHKIGFVPTMGALHEGHLSLIDKAAEHADKVVVSIFVNPRQFAPHEDFDAYPRTEEKDTALLETRQADLVYLPQADEIYTAGEDKDIPDPGPHAEGLEGAHRPHFFGGVVDVVTRLFDHVSPDLAIFGEKDFQQLMVIRDMAADRAPPVEIIGGPIMRGHDGLALSSRNAYLDKGARRSASMLNKILFRAAEDLGRGGDEKTVLLQAKAALQESGFERVDYVSIRWGRVLAAASINGTRLIDNVPVKDGLPTD